MSDRRIPAQNAVMNCFRMKGLDPGRTLTMAEIIKSLPTINHRTVRRAVDDLIQLGQLYVVGEKSNAKIYGTDVAAKLTEKPSTIQYHIRGELVDLPTFIARLFNRLENQNPFSFGHTRTSLLTEELQDKIRRMVAVAIVSSESQERRTEMFTAKAALDTVKSELGDLYRFVSALEDSSVFKVYQQEMLNEDLKKLIKEHPNVYSIVKDLAS